MKYQDRRLAFSVAEVLVALAILAAAAVTVSRFSASMNRGVRRLQLFEVVGWQVENARAEVSTWPYDEITEEEILGRLEVPQELSDGIEAAEWGAAVAVVQTPKIAKRVSLEFRCQYEGQPCRPVDVTFWVLAPSDGLVEANLVEANLDEANRGDGDNQDAASSTVESGL